MRVCGAAAGPHLAVVSNLGDRPRVVQQHVAGAAAAPGDAFAVQEGQAARDAQRNVAPILVPAGLARQACVAADAGSEVPALHQLHHNQHLHQRCKPEWQALQPRSPMEGGLFWIVV